MILLQFYLKFIFIHTKFVKQLSLFDNSIFDNNIINIKLLIM